MNIYLLHQNAGSYLSKMLSSGKQMHFYHWLVRSARKPGLWLLYTGSKLAMEGIPGTWYLVEQSKQLLLGFG
jgi:hypothetical protein